MFKLKAYAPAIILAVGYLAIAGARGQSAVALAKPIDNVLPSVDGYDVKQQTLSEEERRVAGMSDYVVRSYSRDSLMAFGTLVAYYDRQTRGKSIHSPRNCLPGAGWEVLSGGTRTVTANGGSHVINRYILKNGASRAVVYYWYQGRGRVVANEYAVKWNLLRDAAVRGHTEEALVRVVIPVQAMTANARPDAGITDASTLGESISARMIEDVDRVLPRVQKS